MIEFFGWVVIWGGQRFIHFSPVLTHFKSDCLLLWKPRLSTFVFCSCAKKIWKSVKYTARGIVRSKTNVNRRIETGDDRTDTQKGMILRVWPYYQLWERILSFVRITVPLAADRETYRLLGMGQLNTPALYSVGQTTSMGFPFLKETRGLVDYLFGGDYHCVLPWSTQMFHGQEKPEIDIQIVSLLTLRENLIIFSCTPACPFSHLA